MAQPGYGAVRGNNQNSGVRLKCACDRMGGMSRRRGENATSQGRGRELERGKKAKPQAVEAWPVEVVLLFWHSWCPLPSTVYQPPTFWIP